MKQHPYYGSLLIFLAQLLCLGCICQNVTNNSAVSEPRVALSTDVPIQVEIQSDIGTRTSREGDQFVVLTVNDLRIGQSLVLPKGTPGYGLVTRSIRAEHMHANGSLAFTVSYLVAPDGSHVNTHVEGDTAGITPATERNGNAAGAFLSFGLLGVAHMRGNDYVVKKGTKFQVFPDAKQITTVLPNSISPATIPFPPPPITAQTAAPIETSTPRETPTPELP